MNRSRVFVLTASAALCGGYEAHAAEPIANAVTIYSSAQPGAVSPELYRYGGQQGNQVPGYAVVRHERPIELKSGRNDVRFTDVAGLIDPTTVSFESLTDPGGTRVVEQNFQFDLVSTDKLLRKFIDREITVEQTRGDKVDSFTGTLLSTAGGLVLREADGSVRVVSHNSGITLPNLPGGLITRPTLVWDVATKKPGKHATRVAYQTTRYHLVGRLQPHLFRRRRRELLQLECGRMGQHPESVGRFLSRCQNQAHRWRRASCASRGRAFDAGDDESHGGGGQGRSGLSGEDLLRVPLVYAGAPQLLARQLHEADRAVSGRGCACRVRRPSSTTGSRVSTTASVPTRTRTATSASPATRK